MDIKNQVCSVEQAQKLKELGVAQQSLFFWSKSSELQPPVLQNSKDDYDGWIPVVVSAFTVAELGLMIQLGPDGGPTNFCKEMADFVDELSPELNSEALVRAAVLIKALEIDFFKVTEVNERLAS